MHVTRTIVLALALLAHLSPRVSAADNSAIPLDSIWAFDMPGTKDVEPVDREEPRIIWPLLTKIKHDWKSHEGVAVQGEGIDALRAFYDLKSTDQQAPTLTDDKPISLVFYTNITGRYVYVHKVERHENRFIIRYRFISHLTRDLSQHFALIPVGKLPAGNYDVQITRSPITQKDRERGLFEPPRDYEVKVICDSFKFQVSNGREP